MLLGALVALFPLAHATILGTMVPGSTTECMYVDARVENRKIGIYFTVMEGNGGDYDILFSLTAPDSTSIVSETRLRFGEFIFTSTKIGEHSFCFRNDSTNAKLVDFEITIQDDPDRAQMLVPHPLVPEKQTQVEEALVGITGKMNQIQRDQLYFEQKVSRHVSLVRDTQDRMYWAAVVMSLAVAAMAVLQAYSIRSMFSRVKSMI